MVALAHPGFEERWLAPASRRSPGALPARDRETGWHLVPAFSRSKTQASDSPALFATRIPAGEGHETTALIAEPTLCPLARHPRMSGWALTFSAFLHVGIAVAALTVFPPSTRDRAERGGDLAPMEVMVVGAQDQLSTQEGARPEDPEINLPDVPEIPLPEIPLPEIAMPAEAHAVIERLDLSPVPDVSVSLPPMLAPIPPEPQKQRPVSRHPPKVLPKLTAPKPQPRKQAPKAVALPDTPRAHGQQGAGTAAASRTASARGGNGGASATAGTAVMTSYRARVVAHLTRFKTYPEQAQDRGIGGRNAVSLTLSRDGRVMSASLAGSSGHAMLDAATMAAVRRAQPFPAIPDGGPASFSATIGLRYEPR